MGNFIVGNGRLWYHSNMLNERAQIKLAALFKQFPIDLAYLFGSEARGRTGPMSDVDVAVYFDPVTNRSERFDLALKIAGEITDILKRNDVDVAPLNDASPLLAFNALKDGKIIYEKDRGRTIEIEGLLLLVYHDWQPLYERQTKQILGL